jgi:hypothetical protein
MTSHVRKADLTSYAEVSSFQKAGVGWKEGKDDCNDYPFKAYRLPDALTV